MPRYWIVVASKDHATRGASLGFVQSGHGRRSGIARMHRGDGIIFYSPRVEFEGKEPLHAFTAIGFIADDDISQVDESPGFMPFRRRAHFLPAREAKIEPLVPDLGFIRNKRSWGYTFRFGQVEILKEDFEFIAGKMGLNLAELPQGGIQERPE